MSAVMEKQDHSSSQVRNQSRSAGRVYAPTVDILETADELTLLADVPGVEPGSIDIRYERGELVVRGRVALRSDARTYLFREYGVGDFYRAFILGDGIDNSRISAEVSNGVLTIHLPKLERVKPRKIAVQGQ